MKQTANLVLLVTTAIGSICACGFTQDVPTTPPSPAWDSEIFLPTQSTTCEDTTQVYPAGHYWYTCHTCTTVVPQDCIDLGQAFYAACELPYSYTIEVGETVSGGGSVNGAINFPYCSIGGSYTWNYTHTFTEAHTVYLNPGPCETCKAMLCIAGSTIEIIKCTYCDRYGESVITTAVFVPGSSHPTVKKVCWDTPAFCGCDLPGDGHSDEHDLSDEPIDTYQVAHSTIHLSGLILDNEQRQISTLDDLTLVELSFLWDFVESTQSEYASRGYGIHFYITGTDETTTAFTPSELFEAIDLAGNVVIASDKYGDLNFDGVIDLSDVILSMEAIAIVQQGGKASSSADLNADGLVDVNDLDLVIEGM